MGYECEEIIVELTSGTKFEKFLLSKGLNREDGYTIQNQLLNDFYNDHIKEESILVRLNYIINQILIERHLAANNINFLNAQEKLLIYKYNQDHTVMHCSNCKSEILYNDNYCHNCGKKTNYRSTNIIGYNKIDEDNKIAQEINEDNYIKEDMISTNNHNYSKTELLYGMYGFLDYIKNNSVFSSNQKFSNNVDTETIIKEAGKKDYAIHSMGDKSFYLRLNMLPDIELKKLAARFNLNTPPDKEMLISQLIHNADLKSLDKILPNNAYTITEKGLEFIQENPQIFFYNKFLRQYPVYNYNKYYLENKRKYNLAQIGLAFIENIRQDSVERLKWDIYRSTFLTEYLISRYVKNNEKAVLSLIAVFICDMNSWADNRLSTDGIIIAPFIRAMLVNATQEYSLNENAISMYFNQACNKIKLPGFIVPQHNMYIYLKRLLNNETLEIIKKDVKNKLHFNYNENYAFKNKYEQEKVYDKVKNIFY